MANTTLIRTIRDFNEAKEVLLKEEIIACDLESSELDIKTALIEGIGLGTSSKQFFITFPLEIKEEVVKNWLIDVFENKKVIFHNAKYDLELLAQNGFPWPKTFHDTMIMSWLVDENTQHGLKSLATAIFGRETKNWKELDRGLTLFKSEIDRVIELADYCGEDIRNTYDLYFHFLPMLQKEDLMIDYERVELPFILVLARMEMRGVKIDIDWLLKKQKKLKIVLDKLEEQIKIKINKQGINIRSPQQLENLLFIELGYEPVKVTDAGKRSTDNEVLEEIVKKNNLEKDDIVPMLLRFRDLDKLYGTYFIALEEQAGKKYTIHTNFLQHGARTGRLASSDPNLQNIPTREDEWNIRYAFIPREGYKFVIADYSQIELRMLAHFSQDIHMIKTFMEDGDIHATTMKLTGITNRRVAKGINFGLIYGMGARTLAHTLNIKEEEATRYIDHFFAGYPKVRFFIQRIQQATFNDGYVTMITGRRRRFQEIKDKRWYGMIQRQSINTKIQGSSADLIKIAMIQLDRALEPLDAHLLIQIHDEVIIETPIDKVEEVKKITTIIMEGALKLRVPIKTSIIDGDRWIKN